MSSRGEDQLMNQVRDIFSSWEPAAPAGVQEAVYAELGKGGFWKFSLTTLNAWTLTILGGAAALLIGFGLKGDEVHHADTLQNNPSQQVEWSATYPEAQTTSNDWDFRSYPWEMPAEADTPETPMTALAAQASDDNESITFEDAPESLTNRSLSALNPAVKIPSRLTTRAHYLKQDIWTQLQDEAQNELRLIYDVQLSEER